MKPAVSNAQTASPLRTLALSVLVAGTVTALAACGSSSLSQSSASSAAPAAPAASAASGSAGASSAAAAAITEDAALAAKVPAKVRSAGKIVVGSDTTYAPNEFLGGADGTTAQGMDVDLFNAVGKKLGIDVVWQSSNFDAIILGVNSGKYDVGVSSFTINEDRKKSVNMVSYYNAGTLWATAKGNPKGVDIEKLCGLSVGVQKGTTQLDDATARSKKCTDAGQPAINLVVDDNQAKITAALGSGKVVAMAADSPITLYAISQNGDSFEKLGDIYDAAPYGIVTRKADTEFAQAIADALSALKTSGDYEKILGTWGGQAGAISSFAVNP